MTDVQLFPCPINKCDGWKENTSCGACGAGAKLSGRRDYEASRLFDEWWFSVPKEQMLEWGEQGLIQQQFDLWRSQREIKQ